MTDPDASPTTTADARARIVLERCDELARLTEEEGRLTRRFATPPLRAAGERVAEWMRAAGLETSRDAVGNVIGRRGSGGLLLGSHLDTVRDAGRYDGMLGVLVAIACAEQAPGAVEVVAFADEEGTRYGTAYLGSAALAGRFDPAWLARRDADGVAMADALRDFGGDPTGIRLRPARCARATSRCTSSRGRCSRRAACRSAWWTRSPARPARA